jgi:hypothetical protein
MTTRIEELFDESIKLEKNMSELYSLYAKLFEDDGEFWSQLKTEEDAHAAILTALSGIYVPLERHPDELLTQDLGILKDSNEGISATIGRYREQPPDKREAYGFAVELEKSAGELQYQKAISMSTESRELQGIQKVNADCRDHAARICERIKELEL